MITNEQYKRWRRYAEIISNSKEEAQELLHELLLRMLEKNSTEETLNDNYIFMSLRNNFLRTRKHVHRETDLSRAINIQEDPIDWEEIQAKEGIFEAAHAFMDEVLRELTDYEGKLFTLHFVYGIPQRAISRETGIGITPIHKCIKKIKTIINEKKENSKGGA